VILGNAHTHGTPAAGARCALCARIASVVDSHIVPKFVFRYLRQTSPGLIRSSDSPNRRQQDGPVIPLLCSDCEELFSGWEAAFADKVFRPLHEKKFFGIPQFQYGPWALKFAVSLSWRVVQFMKARAGRGHHSKHLTPGQGNTLAAAETTWAAFLRGEVANPGTFEQHIFPLDALMGSRSERLSPAINRYLLRAVDMDIVAAPDTAFVFTKMPGLMVIGFVVIPDRRHWVGGKLHVSKGVIGTRTYKLPGAMLGYVSRRADATAAAVRSLSPRQLARSQQVIDQNLDNLAGSEPFRAMAADVAIFGDDAFAATRGEDHK
jgi:hypothetical protein